MDETMAFLMPRGGGGTMLAAVNEHLAVTGLSITREDALMLAERRVESLAETERIEFGPPAVAAIAKAIASSPFLMQDNLADVLAELQDVFYVLRDELPVDVPDAEIVEALGGCFDAHGGDAAAVTALPKEEVMAFSEEYRLAQNAEDEGAYCIVDDEGRVYTVDPAEWDYDEQAAGWDGEGWSDDWDD
jgi:hypothetical protein